HGNGHFGNVAHLGRQVAAHEVDVFRQVFPDAADVLDLGLAAQFAVGAHFAGHAGHFRGEAIEPVHHGVDGVLELENLAAHVHRNLAGVLAAGHGTGHLGDVAHLRGQVAAHPVDVIGQVFPGAGDAGDLGLAAELAVGAHFAGHARHFGGEAV